MREEILDKEPKARLRVYAIWFSMIWTDARSRWPEDVLRDPRVVHFWDDGRVVGRWYEENVTHRGEEVEWDAFFLYGAAASWDATLPEAVAWGRTILSAKERLHQALQLLHGRVDRLHRQSEHA